MPQPLNEIVGGARKSALLKQRRRRQKNTFFARLLSIPSSSELNPQHFIRSATQIRNVVRAPSQICKESLLALVSADQSDSQARGRVIGSTISNI
jgi:hypothetical protein